MADTSRNGVCNRQQHQVARDVTGVVVDRLEVIQVDEHQGSRIAAGGLIDQSLGALLQHLPVGQACQNVVCC